MLLVAGITNTFPVFLPALLAEFGGSRAATASTASLLWVGGALLSPVAGYLVARWNPRRLVSLGLGLAALGMLLGSLAPTLPLFLLAMGLGGGIGVGLTGMTTHAALIADAYVRRRGLATGIAFGGSMAAYALAAPAQWIITHWGWRPAFWCYAAAIVALIPWVWRVHPTRLASVSDRGNARLGETRGDRLEHRSLRRVLEPAGDVHHAAALRVSRHDPAHALLHRSGLHGGRGLPAPRHRGRAGGRLAARWRAWWPIASADPPRASSRSPARCWACSA